MKKYQKLLCFFGLGVSLFSFMGCSSTQESVVSTSDGITNNSIIAVKDYDIVGPIRMTSERSFNGTKWSGSKITYDMLLQKAHEMNADDVINIKIDTTKTTEDSNLITKETYNYTANGLAINYTEALMVAPTISIQNPLEDFNTNQPEISSDKTSWFNWKTAGLISAGVVSFILIGEASAASGN